MLVSRCCAHILLLIMASPNFNLYLIRHAESVMNTNNHLVGGRSNETPLTERGMGQARQLGAYLLEHEIAPTGVFTSPAVRTKSTAATALEVMGLDVRQIVADEIQELEQGEWVGRERSEVYTDEVMQQIALLGKDFKAPGGESMNDVGQRMHNWVSTTFVEPSNKDRSEDFLVFSHGLAIRCLASYLHNWCHRMTYVSVTENASATLFTGAAESWQLEYLGRDTQE